MILSSYIARRFAWMVTRIFLIFFGIMMLIDMVDQLRRFSGQEVGLGRLIQLSALNVPASLYRILPLIVILAAIALFLGLARSSELVVVRAAGRSGLRFLMTPVLAALALGGISVLVFNPLVAATTQQHDVLNARLKQGAESVLSVSEDGLWLRQGGSDGQTVIHANRANADGTQLFGATFLTFGATGLPETRIEADEALLTPGAWALTGVKRWQLAASNPEAAATLAPRMALPSDLTRDAIRDSFGTPEAIPIWDLPEYIAALERAGFSARNHRVWMQMELAMPLLLAAMVLVAAGFTMRHARFGKTGSMVLLALAGGFGIFFLRNFAQVLGENGQIPILLAAWSPPVAAVLMAMGLLLHLEDG
ncbi:LPS export ABC transporter permease LptG [Paracoccaceae bacterium Fryx2]|nr:LPS export ABC transporter permease LptG [Paracoccaceae bacterium Fryx2]